MDFADNTDEATFREQFRTWLAANAPRAPLPDDDDEHAGAELDWQQLLHRGGWSGLSLPREYGGGGHPIAFEAILSEELGRAGAPPILDTVYLSQVVLAFGTEEQCQQWIPRMLSGEDRWCQGFSEAGAGSDLASLTTAARRDGAGWLINGAKRWTTRARWATHCLVLARTDPAAPVHQGISAFVVSTDATGFTSNPIRQSTGHAEFSEVFFNNVYVHDGCRIGSPGDGWKLAMTTVTIERGPSDNGYAARHRALLERLERSARTSALSGAHRSALASSYVDVEVMRIQIQDSLSKRLASGAAGLESSADKLLMIRTEQALHHLALSLAGGNAIDPEQRELIQEFLYSRAVSVYGGTEQIQRTIIAQRVLKLPRA